MGRGTDRSGCITRFRSGTMELTFAGWVDGRMHGIVSEETRHGWVISRYRKGVRHGISRAFGLKMVTNDLENFCSVSFFENGSVVGLVWKQLCGGAYLVGPVEDSGILHTLRQHGWSATYPPILIHD